MQIEEFIPEKSMLSRKWSFPYNTGSSNVHSYIFNQQTNIDYELETELKSKESFALSELFRMSV